MADNLSDADDCEVFSIDNDLASRRSHALPARTEEFKLRGLCGGGALPRRDGAKPRHHTISGGRTPQRFDELRAIHFPRSFTG
jgi:hypothetical protein